MDYRTREMEAETLLKEFNAHEIMDRCNKYLLFHHSIPEDAVLIKNCVIYDPKQCLSEYSNKFFRVNHYKVNSFHFSAQCFCFEPQSENLRIKFENHILDTGRVGEQDTIQHYIYSCRDEKGQNAIAGRWVLLFAALSELSKHFDIRYHYNGVNHIVIHRVYSLVRQVMDEIGINYPHYHCRASSFIPVSTRLDYRCRSDYQLNGIEDYLNLAFEIVAAVYQKMAVVSFEFTISKRNSLLDKCQTEAKMAIESEVRDREEGVELWREIEAKLAIENQERLNRKEELERLVNSGEYFGKHMEVGRNEFERLLWTYPMRDRKRIFNVSDVTLAKARRAYKVRNHTRNFWSSHARKSHPNGVPKSEFQMPPDWVCDEN
ncbi:hypothetical protein FCL40_18150 [Ferrimonas sediminicola]|uniref:Uncharacterized protein n=1 Tax=Ferrimonas sediminicola TaxID=2569538 RepID=A0A4U1B887_9GAMM|nr:hypothetical protein [Ferrimonas sediminicola]TKB46217.1 hypothetical protein FCL40_18150 [Ferrimonas sediminicola]